MSDQAVLLLKWFSYEGIILAKGQLVNSYTFWTMANYTTVDCLSFFESDVSLSIEVLDLFESGISNSKMHHKDFFPSDFWSFHKPWNKHLENFPKNFIQIWLFLFKLLLLRSLNSRHQQNHYYLPTLLYMQTSIFSSLTHYTVKSILVQFFV